MATKDSGKRSRPRRTTSKPTETQAPPPTRAAAPRRTRQRAATPAETAGPPVEASETQTLPGVAQPEIASVGQEADLPLTQAESDVAETPAAGTARESGAGIDLEVDEEGEQGRAGDEAAEGQGVRFGTPIDSTPRGRHERPRLPHGNALGTLIESYFAAPGSPVRSYSDLERRSGISREALSRYVTARADRRRSPTIDTLVAIADAMHLSLDAVCRAAAASVKGLPLPSEDTRRIREEVISPLVSGLSDDQFSAIVELLRQMRPATS